MSRAGSACGRARRRTSKPGGAHWPPGTLRCQRADKPAAFVLEKRVDGAHAQHHRVRLPSILELGAGAVPIDDAGPVDQVAAEPDDRDARRDSVSEPDAGAYR